MNGYELSRVFWDFAIDNPEKIKPTHIAIYFHAVEVCNRLGWKPKFGLPTTCTMEAIGVKSYNTYKKCFNDIVEWGFFEIHQRSKNQFTSNIIALSKFDKASTKALDKALTKQSESIDKAVAEAVAKALKEQVAKQVQSIDSIDKQLNNKQKEPLNQEQTNKESENPLKNSLGVYFPFFENVLKFFNISTEQHHRNCSGYILRKINDEKIGDFVKQTEAMFLYKENNPKEKTQTWKNYIYDYDNEQANDWLGMIKGFKSEKETQKEKRMKLIETTNFQQQ